MGQVYSEDQMQKVRDEVVRLKSQNADFRAAVGCVGVPAEDVTRRAVILLALYEEAERGTDAGALTALVAEVKESTELTERLGHRDMWRRARQAEEGERAADHEVERLREMSASSIDAALRASLEWGRETFPEATAASCAKHLKKEAAELLAEPTSAEEMADVVMLVSHGAQRAGVDLAGAIRAKLEINKARTWGTPNAEGFREHDRDAPAEPDEYHDEAAGSDELTEETRIWAKLQRRMALPSNWGHWDTFIRLLDAVPPAVATDDAGCTWCVAKRVPTATAIYEEGKGSPTGSVYCNRACQLAQAHLDNTWDADAKSPSDEECKEVGRKQAAEEVAAAAPPPYQDPGNVVAFLKMSECAKEVQYDQSHDSSDEGAPQGAWWFESVIAKSWIKSWMIEHGAEGDYVLHAVNRSGWIEWKEVCRGSMAKCVTHVMEEYSEDKADQVKP